MPICSRSAKMAPVRAEKKIDFFKILKMDFAKKSRFKPMKYYINGILPIKLAKIDAGIEFFMKSYIFLCI